MREPVADLRFTINTAFYSMAQAVKAINAGDEYDARLFVVEVRRILSVVQEPTVPKTSRPARKGDARVM